MTVSFWALPMALALASAAPPLGPVIESRVDVSNAERFAKLWRETGGQPTAAQLQAQYLDHGGRAIEIFTKGRIESAEKLAEFTAANPKLYQDAIERCLPWAADQDGQFRAVNLGLRGLFPGRTPPAVAVVFGRDNSGGTAGEGMQVIGLEVICRLAPDRASFDTIMRKFFAHEAAHTFQDIGGPKVNSEFLLSSIIAEGTADYIAHLVTGIQPDPKRAAWAVQRGDALWTDLAADRQSSVANMKSPGDFNDIGSKAVLRWVMNAGSAPQGWPDELGYWAGEQIARAYVEASPDKQAALDELLAFDDSLPIVVRASQRLPQLKALLGTAK